MPVMVMGRPPIYNDTNTPAETEAYIAWCLSNKVLPKSAGLALHLGVRRSTIFEWAKAHPNFADKLDKLNATQEVMLIDGGLKGDYSAVITKLILAKQGYHDKSETDITTGGQPLPVATNSTLDIDALAAGVAEELRKQKT